MTVVEPAPAVRVYLRAHRVVPIDSITIRDDRLRGPVEATIGSLIDSIRTLGLITPILVNDDCSLVDGGQRLEALRRLGATEVPVIIRNPETDLEWLQIEAASNNIRTPFSPVQAAAARKRMREMREGRRTHTGRPLAERRKSWSSELAVAETGVSRTTMDRVDQISRIAESADQPVLVRRAAAEGLDAIDRGVAKVDTVLRSVRETAAASAAVSRYPELAVLPNSEAILHMSSHLDTLTEDARALQLETLKRAWDGVESVAHHVVVEDELSRWESFAASCDSTILTSFTDLRERDALPADARARLTSALAIVERHAARVRDLLTDH